MLSVYGKITPVIPKRHILKDVHVFGTDVESGKFVELNASRFDAVSFEPNSKLQQMPQSKLHSMFERKIGFFRPGL